MTVSELKLFQEDRRGVKVIEIFSISSMETVDTGVLQPPTIETESTREVVTVVSELNRRKPSRFPGLIGGRVYLHMPRLELVSAIVLELVKASSLFNRWQSLYMYSSSTHNI